MAGIKNHFSWKRFNLAMTIVWAFVLPLAIVTGWIWSVAFISAASIYANVVGHLSAWRADDNPQIDKIEKEVRDINDGPS